MMKPKCSCPSRRITVLVIFVVSVIMGHTIGIAADFDIIDLGTLGGANSEANAINDLGHVVGGSYVAGDAEYHAFFWSEETGMVDLTVAGTDCAARAINNNDQVIGIKYFWSKETGAIEFGTLGGANTNASAINDSGQVVGSSETSDGTYHAFFWTREGGMVDLGTLGSGRSWAMKIDDKGQVFGRSATANGEWRVFSWTQEGGMVDVGLSPIARVSAVNNRGQIVGARYGNRPYHPFFWSKETGIIELGTLGGTDTSPYAINDSGQVVGQSKTAQGISHAFFWTLEGGMVDLGTLGGGWSWASKIDNSGQVIGDSGGDVEEVGFFWTQEDGMVRLKPLLGGTYSEPRAINSEGQIAGEATLEGDEEGHAVLWKTRVAVDIDGPLTSNVISIPNPASVNSQLTVEALLDDTNTGSSNISSAECSLDGTYWISMNAEDGIFDSQIETVMGTFNSPSEAGIYSLCVRGTDEADNIGTPECTMLVIYNPDGEFVTGGGWLTSPEGAYIDMPDLTGKANFGFVSKYTKGATTPTGETEFQFKVADLNFHSTSYEWLVVNQNNSNAQFKGSGTINGLVSPLGDDYRFMLWAGDGNPDTFRIKIWWEDLYEDELVYDNGFNQSIGGGSIIIHSK